jgi:hypothetical protein
VIGDFYTKVMSQQHITEPPVRVEADQAVLVSICSRGSKEIEKGWVGYRLPQAYPGIGAYP